MWTAREKARAYFATWRRTVQQRWRHAGACVSCGLPTEKNPRTGKPFARCFKHRRKQSLYSQAFHKKHGRPDKRVQKVAA